MAGNAVAQFAEQVMIGVSNVLVSLGTAWIKTPSINLETNAAQKFITEHIQFLVLALLAGAIIFVGIRIVWTRRLEPLQDIMAGVFQFLVVSLGGIKIMSMFIAASDEFAAWILKQAVGDSGDFATSLLTVLAISDGVAPGLGSMVLIIGGIIALVANLIQVGLLFVRNALLILLAAVMVLPAAMPGSTMGKEWFKKLGGWFLAFALFKPAASIIYATGILLVGSGGIGGGDQLVAFAMGMLFLVLAPIALPALMAFIVPSVSALSAGGGGGAGMAMAAGSMATGAAKVASGSGGASGSESSSHSSQSESSTQSTSNATGASSGASSGTTSGSSSGPPDQGGTPQDTGSSTLGTSGGAPASTGASTAGATAGSSTGAGGTAAVGSSAAGGTAATGAASAGAGTATGGATIAAQAAVEGIQQVTGAIQNTVDSETSGATGAGQTDE